MDIIETIKASLKQYQHRCTSSHIPPSQKASVLIPLFVKKEELCVLMTLRSLNLRQSAGEVCFPGGKCDSGDRDEIVTALREAEEEIGLSPDQVEVLGRLFPVMSKSGLLVTPVVAFIKDTFQVHPNPEEDSDSKEFHIWGLTAILAILVAVLVLGREPMFEVDFDTRDPLPFFERDFQLQISKL